MTQEHERELQVGKLSEQIALFQEEINERSDAIKRLKRNSSNFEIEATEMEQNYTMQLKEKEKEINTMRKTVLDLPEKNEKLEEELNDIRELYRRESSKLEEHNGIIGKLKEANSRVENKTETGETNEGYSTEIDVLHIKVQSLRNKTVDLELCMNEAKIVPKIFCIMEHWFPKNDIHIVNLPGYELISRFSRDSPYGGSFIFAASDVRMDSVLNLVQFSVLNHIEMSAGISHVEKLIVIAVYRPPVGDFDCFLGALGDSHSGEVCFGPHEDL
ncbi:hypothetical protein HHI36_018231 [Cryptolaemus montrouzieri]|uniref:Uncharacterized protein n=1 Tax=Cryptolaemus montrouzieri TaxID=559131 RepID=A0ABD2NZR0_9CUCU